MDIKEPFQVFIASSVLDVEGTQKTCYFISTNNLVNQVLSDCLPDELVKLSTLTPLVVYSNLFKVDEIQILADICKVVDRQRFILDFINPSNKTGICIFFTDEISAAKVVKLIGDNIDKTKYSIELSE